MAGGKSIGDLFVTVSAKPKKFNTALTDSEKRMKRFKSAAVSTFKAVGVAVVAMGAVAAVGIGKAIAAASDLEEVTSKFNTVFEGQQDIAEAWSATLVESYMMSTREAKFYLSSIQDLLVPMGMNAKAAGELSNEVVKLSADLGSFNNLETEQVMLDIQSALVGNFETMKKYGVVLNMTVVAQKALEMGLAETSKELTAGMRAQAAYALMVEGSAAAIGDVARTSDGYANQLKKLKSRIEEISGILGNQFLPLATEVLKTMNEMADANMDAFGGRFAAGVKVALTGMQAFHNAWLGVSLVGQTAVVALSHSLSGLYAVLKNTMLVPLNLISKLLVKLGAIDSNPFDAMSEGLENFREASKGVAGDILGSIEKTNVTYSKWKDSLDAVEEKTKEVGETTKMVIAEEEAAARWSIEEKRKLQAKYSDELMEARIGETAFAKMQLDEQAADMEELGFKAIEIHETLAERYKELEQEKALATGTFMEGVGVGLEQLAENAMTIAEIGAETTSMLFNSVSQGIGKSVAQSIVFGQSMAKSMKAVMKNTAASMIANLVKIGVQRLVLKSINVGATAAEHRANSAVSVADTFSNAFAATAKIPIVGPILAPIVAAASAAAALAGISSWGSKGAEGAVSVAHGGLDSVPREQTFLLDKGERVLSPSQNEDLTEFLATGGGGRNVTFNITAFDSDTMVNTVRNEIIPMLQDALDINAEGFTDSIQAVTA